MVITYSAIDDLISTLTAQWNTTSSGGSLPTLVREWEEKEVGLEGAQEEIIISAPIETVKPFALYGQAYWREATIKLDIRTFTSQARQTEIITEAERIILKNIRQSAPFLQIDLVESSTINHDYRNAWRHVITIKYKAVQDVVFT